jgi:hypothetical protein
VNVCLIVGIWILMAVLVNPIGDFPLNDDWAYGWSVKVLVETGDFRLSDWTAVNLLPQVLWGAVFSLPGGFSFTALRFSTLTLGLVGVLATYGLLREIKASPGVSLVGALVVALNPIYFALSNSFMSDVPSFALATGAGYFLLRGLRRHTVRDLVAGIVLAIVSILNRQTGLILLPAFAAAWVARQGLSPRSLVAAGVPTLVGGAVYVSYAEWLETTGRTPHLYNLQTTLLLRSLSSEVVETAWTCGRNSLVIATYLGLFLLPVLAMTGSATDGGRRRRRWPRLVLAAAVVVAAIGAAKFQRMPSAGNVLDVAGVGPSTISRPTRDLSAPYPLHRGWQLVTALGVVGAAVLLRSSVEVARRVVARGRDPETVTTAVFAITAIVLYLLPLGVLRQGYWFDRYLLPVLPLAMILAWTSSNASPQRAHGALGALLLVPYGLFAVAATHDYLSWSRARWQAVEVLLSEPGVSLEDVDAGGGREVKGWHLGHRVTRCDGDRGRETTAAPSWGDFSCLTRTGDERHVVSLSMKDGYRVTHEYVFSRWLPFRAQPFYVLRRQDTKPSDDRAAGDG